MSDEDKMPVVEISGAAAANLLRTFAECGSGSLLLELGLRAVVTRTTENSDLHTAHRTTRECFKKFHPKQIRRFVITEKAPTRAFSWLKAATITFTFKTLLRHYAIIIRDGRL